MTETKEIPKLENPPNGWLLYDADCRFCTDLAARFARRARRRGIALLPLQTPWVQRELGLDPNKPATEMVLLTRDHQTHGGVDAFLYLAELSRLTRPLAALGRRGPIHRLLDRSYRWIAVRRTCLGACPTNKKHGEQGR